VSRVDCCNIGCDPCREHFDAEPFAKALSRINPALPDGTEVSLSIDGVEVYRLALSSLRSLVSA